LGEAVLDVEDEGPVDVPLYLSLKQKVLVALVLYLGSTCMIAGMAVSRYVGLTLAESYSVEGRDHLPLALDVVVDAGEYQGDVPCLSIDWAKDYFDSSGLHQTCSAALNAFDVDRDGVMEILIPFRKNSDRLLCVNGVTGEAEWAYPPMDRQIDCGDIMGSPCIGDLDGDGRYEVLFIGRIKDLYCLDAATGSCKWVYRCDGNVEAPTVYDIDGNGKKEVIVQAGRTLTVLDYRGRLVWDYDLSYGAPQILTDRVTCPNAFDVDQDGEVEVIAVDYSVHCLGPGGEMEWATPICEDLGGPWPRHMQPVIADLNRDSRYEIVIHNYDGILHVLAADGSIMWSQKMGQGSLDEDAGRHEGGFALADLDRDGFLEIVTSDALGSVECLNHDGTELWHHKLPGEIWSGILIGDMTGDGRLDVIVEGELNVSHPVYPRGCLLVLDGETGEEEMVWPYALCASTPSAGDIDGDGKVEIIAQAYGDRQPFLLLSSGVPYDPEFWWWSYKYRTPDNRAIVEIGEV